jgi:hypothetical protein
MSNASALELIYAAKIEPDGENFLVTFRDIENVFTSVAVVYNNNCRMSANPRAR